MQMRNFYFIFISFLYVHTLSTRFIFYSGALASNNIQISRAFKQFDNGTTIRC